MPATARSRVVPSSSSALVRSVEFNEEIVRQFLPVPRDAMTDAEILVAAQPDGVIAEQLIETYIAAALRRTLVESTEDGRSFATVPVLGDVWADGATIKEAVEALDDVVHQWVLMKIEDQDHDLPVLGTLDLNWL